MFSRTDRGFTLIEVMVSLAIMSLVVTVAFAGMRIGLDSWDRGSRAIDDMDNRLLVERLLKRQLALAFEWKATIDDETFVMFRGSNNHLEFVSDYSLADGAGDFRKIDYGFSGGSFLYGEKALFGYEPEHTEDLPGEQLAGFDRVVFKYLSRDEQGLPVWLDEWKITMGLPVAVQVQIDEDIFVIRLVNREDR